MDTSIQPPTVFASTQSRLVRILDHPHFTTFCFTAFVFSRLLVVFVPAVSSDFSDAGWYLNRALSIARGDGYSERGLPTAYWPIGYPGFLGALFAVFGASQRVGQLANVALGAGSFLLMLELVRYLFRDERVARLAALLFTLYPNQLAYTPFLLTEIYFTFLVLLGSALFLLSRSVWPIIASGVVFGVATLTKPQVILLPLAWGVLGMWSHRLERSVKPELLKVALVYALIAVTIIPWTLRNISVFGVLVPISTNGGFTLATGNNSSARGDYTVDPSVVARINFSVRDQVAADQRARELAVQWIREHPREFLTLVPLKVWRLWAPDGEGVWWYQAGYRNYDASARIFRVLRVLNQAYYAALLGAFALALLLIRRLRVTSAWPYSIFPYVFALYVTAISIVFSGQSRFHFPVMPWIMMVAAWLLCNHDVWWSGARREHSRAL